MKKRKKEKAKKRREEKKRLKESESDKRIDTANFLGAVAGAYFFTYLTDVFDREPWLSGVRNIIVTKTEKVYHY